MVVGTTNWLYGRHAGFVLVEQELDEDIVRASLPIEDDLDIRRHGDDLIDGARLVDILNIRRCAYSFLESQEIGEGQYATVVTEAERSGGNAS